VACWPGGRCGRQLMTGHAGAGLGRIETTFGLMAEADGNRTADDAKRRPPVLKTGAASLLASLAVVPNPVLAGQAAEASLSVTTLP
jgi:hypothetical protein